MQAIAEESVERLAQMMAFYRIAPKVQLEQTRFRMRLASFWEIGLGQTVLEIGCGQGDTTAVLAHATGPTGRVYGIDNAPRTYGSPICVGESTDHLLAGELGAQMHFKFDFDLTTAALTELPIGRVDAVVLCHSLFYFHSLERIESLLQKLRGISKKICLSDWDLVPQRVEQIPHLLSLLTSSELYRVSSDISINARILVSKYQIEALLRGCGWEIDKEIVVDDGCLLSDARSDIKQTIDLASGYALKFSAFHDASASRIETLSNTLRGSLNISGVEPLGSFAIRAH